MTTTIPQNAPALPPGRREHVTSGGAILESTRVAIHQIDASTFWAVWSERCGGYTVSMLIELARWTPSSGWRFWREGEGLARFDCPLEFLDMAPAIDRDFRDKVWRHHETKLGEQP